MSIRESSSSELEELRIQLQEANETIHAIRTGQVDALIVQQGDEHQLYTLKSADQTYRVFIEKMKEGAVTLNKEGIILYSNSQFASMVNLPLTKVIGLYFSDFIPIDLRNAFQILIEESWHSDKKVEMSLMNKDNTLIPFLLSITSLDLDEGPALSIILTDLSSQKQTEQELKDKNSELEEARLSVIKVNTHLEELVQERTRELIISQEHFQFLADNIPVMVWTRKADGSAKYFNKQWHDYTGLSFEESSNPDFNERSRSIIHTDDREAALKAWAIALQNKTKFEFEYRIKRASNGIYRWHLNKGEPLKDEAGNVVAWFGTSTDIEDQKKEIERKDEFIGVASHELKTPLTSLKGYLQLMENREDLPEDIKLYITRGNISVNKLHHLINNLLDVSRIKAGQLDFDKQNIDLTNVVNNCVENCLIIYPGYNIKKELANEVMVIGNEERLEQVLMNLLNNAVKYSPENKEIVVRVEKKKQNALVSVIDCGIGMSLNDQKKIFERFYRAGDSKLTQGLGMGLYISAEIIKEHKGKMAVKSKLNEGAEFSFSIPLATDPN